jgi:uncharacterized protein DUF5063
MSSAPARGLRGEGSGDGWHPLAERVAAQARDFLDGVGALANGQGGDEIVPLLLLEVSQIGADPDLDQLRVGLAARLSDCDEYGELFDPYADTRPTAFRLSDDLAAVAADLIHGLQHYEAGRSLEALWWWQYSYVNHWGTHGGAALRALHAIVAHALLDVAEEATPG